MKSIIFIESKLITMGISVKVALASTDHISQKQKGGKEIFQTVTMSLGGEVGVVEGGWRCGMG